MTINVNAIFQTDLHDAIRNAGGAGMPAEAAVYLMLAQAFGLFASTTDCGDSNAFVEFLRVAHLAAIGFAQTTPSD